MGIILAGFSTRCGDVGLLGCVQPEAGRVTPGRASDLDDGIVPACMESHDDDVAFGRKRPGTVGAVLVRSALLGAKAGPA